MRKAVAVIAVTAALVLAVLFLLKSADRASEYSRLEAKRDDLAYQVMLIERHTEAEGVITDARTDESAAPGDDVRCRMTLSAGDARVTLKSSGDTCRRMQGDAHVVYYETDGRLRWDLSDPKQAEKWHDEQQLMKEYAKKVRRMTRELKRME